MRILVTGATGFIGSNLVEELVKQKYKIKVLVRKGEPGKIPKNREDSLELLNKSLKIEEIINLLQ